jgi:hypothetical protein
MPTNITSGILTSYTLTATNTNAPSGQQSVTQVLSYTVSPTATAGTATTTPAVSGVTTSTTAGIGTTSPTGGGSNNAVSSINQVQVLEGGIDYDSNDEVVVVGGNNGAEFTLNTTALGQIVSVNVLNPGYGFTTVPEIQINSKNGVGAKFLTQLKFTPLDQFLIEQELEALDPTKLVKVIDCVYK